MLVEFGKANLLDKARQQPDKVGMVLDKVKTDGLMPTLDAVSNKLEQRLRFIYHNCFDFFAGHPAGTVLTEQGCGDKFEANGAFSA
ncbi:MAG: hypothetical protein ND866_15350 [Pyrinomonadaceae bacterium]|nr:hypothetical protein [Pyrinomonadaceae bacterium]